MVENFENKNNLNVDDREGNWSVEKTANGNSVFNEISNGWSDLLEMKLGKLFDILQNEF